MKKKNNYYYRLTVGCLCLLMAHTAKAQYTTSIELISGTPNAKIKAKMEKNGGALLTELNNAQGEARNLSLGKIEIDKSAVSSLTTMWEICPFRCDELEIVERCLNTPSGGYQIRNIPAIMEPRKGERFDEDKYQELVLNFDASGRISDLCFAINKNQYMQIMRTGLETTDLRRRAMVIEFVEQFRTAYNRKDLDYIRDIFSDDALIITGKVVERKSADEVGGYKLKSDVEYKVQNKEQYIDGLTRVFGNNTRINVVFEDIKVNKHGTKDEIYGVKLIQHWNSGSYSDKGYLFLLWDFKDENKPKIHVRTWQPYDETPEDKIIDIHTFKQEK
ncbi:MAG: nuclear transport factor 2 family protein [Prevotellaceae bacterium]|jgi:hypothetical protein|nr:nuclear transport factor 2 family protein [Prevotellaceae bacterium]